MRIDPEDPRLTAYVLGELEDADRREIEEALQTSPELRRSLEEIRSTTRALAEALGDEGEWNLTPQQRQEVVQASEGEKPRRTRVKWYGLAGLSAAASLLLVVFLTTQESPREMVALTPSMQGPPVDVREAVPEPKLPPVDRRQMESARTVQESSQQGSDPADLKTERDIGESETPTAEKPASKVESAVVPAEQERFPAPSTSALEVARQRLSAPVANAVEEARLVSVEGRALGRGSYAAESFVALPDSAGDAVRADQPAQVPVPWNTEAYDRLVENPFWNALQNPLSTFSIDVDTASYSNVRRFLSQGIYPPKDAVRIEELVNYFDYEYPQPQGSRPFSVTIEATVAPWKNEHRLLRVGLKGRVVESEQRPAANLVFLLDVSGSMDSPNKLPLLKQAMRMLVERLKDDDHVSIVVYAGASGLVLPSTPGSRREEILSALDRLDAGGSTNGAAGIQLAYQVASTHYVEQGINRVILATDGDFNVGTTSQGDLTRLIEEKAKTGIFLTVLGFGMGNYKDSTLEKLADQGNGNYGYIDTLSEARKLLVEQLNGTLVTIAKDVKIQVEFNPARVSAYRLIGYENRILRHEDFNDDTKDAGEIGAGHTVTALYEVVPVGVEVPTGSVDPLKYQSLASSRPAGASSEEALTVKLRYKLPGEDKSQLLEVPFVDAGRSFAQASGDLKFAAAVASFGMLLRDSEYKGETSFGAILEMAGQGIVEDRHGYRGEFVELVRVAKRIADAARREQ